MKKKIKTITTLSLLQIIVLCSSIIAFSYPVSAGTLPAPAISPSQWASICTGIAGSGKKVDLAWIKSSEAVKSLKLEDSLTNSLITEKSVVDNYYCRSNLAALRNLDDTTLLNGLQKNMADSAQYSLSAPGNSNLKTVMDERMKTSPSFVEALNGNGYRNVRGDWLRSWGLDITGQPPKIASFDGNILNIQGVNGGVNSNFDANALQKSGFRVSIEENGNIDISGNDVYDLKITGDEQNIGDCNLNFLGKNLEITAEQNTIVDMQNMKATGLNGNIDIISNNAKVLMPDQTYTGNFQLGLDSGYKTGGSYKFLSADSPMTVKATTINPTANNPIANYDAKGGLDSSLTETPNPKGPTIEANKIDSLKINDNIEMASPSGKMTINPPDTIINTNPGITQDSLQNTLMADIKALPGSDAAITELTAGPGSDATVRGALSPNLRITNLDTTSHLTLTDNLGFNPVKFDSSFAKGSENLRGIMDTSGAEEVIFNHPDPLGKIAVPRATDTFTATSNNGELAVSHAVEEGNSVSTGTLGNEIPKTLSSIETAGKIWPILGIVAAVGATAALVKSNKKSS